MNRLDGEEMMVAFALLIPTTLGVLLWRIIRAEDGHGFMPISRDAFGELVSVALGAFSILMLGASAYFFALAVEGW